MTEQIMSDYPITRGKCNRPCSKVGNERLVPSPSSPPFLTLTENEGRLHVFAEGIDELEVAVKDRSYGFREVHG